MGSIIRKGDYKLIKYHLENDFELYNLKNDIGETTNLAAQDPSLAEELLSDLNNWLSETNAQLPRNKDSIPDGELFGKRID